MTRQKYSWSKDGYRWVCPSLHSLALGKSTLLDMRQLPLRYFLWVIFEAFGREVNAKRCVDALKEKNVSISLPSMRLIYQDIRRILHGIMLAERDQTKMGGPYCRVEVDESNFNHSTFALRKHKQKKPTNITKTAS